MIEKLRITYLKVTKNCQSIHTGAQGDMSRNSYGIVCPKCGENCPDLAICTTYLLVRKAVTQDFVVIIKVLLGHFCI